MGFRLYYVGLLFVLRNAESWRGWVQAIVYSIQVLERLASLGGSVFVGSHDDCEIRTFPYNAFLGQPRFSQVLSCDSGLMRT